MSKARTFLKYWIPLLVWMIVIFSASGDSQSFQRSSRIIGPLLQWLFPSMPQEQVDSLVTFVRKCAHLTEYAVLAWLFWRAIWKPRPREPRPWTWKEFAIPVLFVALYAVTDELHQNFIPNRYGSINDVILDTVGGVFGMLLLWRLRERRRKRVIMDQSLPHS